MKLVSCDLVLCPISAFGFIELPTFNAEAVLLKFRRPQAADQGKFDVRLTYSFKRLVFDCSLSLTDTYGKIIDCNQQYRQFYFFFITLDLSEMSSDQTATAENAIRCTSS